MMRFIVFYGRLLLVVIWFAIACLISLFLLAFRWKDPSMGAVLGRIVHWGGTRALGLKVVVENEKALYTDQPCIYVGNHQSNMDIVTMGCMYPYKTVVIGKKELKWFPLFGVFFAGSGNIMIDRSNRSHSMAGLEIAKNAMLERGVSIWIFPEGTRNRGRSEMLPFKKGAFHLAIAAQVPIVPIAHQHLYTYFDLASRRIKSGTTVRIKILDPIPTKGMTADDLPALMADVRKKLEAALNMAEMRGKQEEPSTHRLT